MPACHYFTGHLAELIKKQRNFIFAICANMNTRAGYPYDKSFKGHLKNVIINYFAEIMKDNEYSLHTKFLKSPANLT